MSVGPLNPVNTTAAGTPLSQATGTDVARTQRDVTSNQRAEQSQTQAESAAGIPQTDGQDLDPGERDADGRRPWRLRRHKPGTQIDATPTGNTSPAGHEGGLLDLSG
jgi:hypothetical protein